METHLLDLPPRCAREPSCEQRCSLIAFAEGLSSGKTSQQASTGLDGVAHPTEGPEDSLHSGGLFDIFTEPLVWITDRPVDPFDLLNGWESQCSLSHSRSSA